MIMKIKHLVNKSLQIQALNTDGDDLIRWIMRRRKCQMS